MNGNVLTYFRLIALAGIVISIAAYFFKEDTFKKKLQITSSIIALIFFVFSWIIGARLDKELLIIKNKLPFEQLNNYQKSLVKEIWKYQKRNKLPKVIIGRDGYVIAQSEKEMANFNIASAVLGKRSDQFRFELLINSIPDYFLKRIPDMLWDSPYVVTIPEDAREIIEKNE